MREPWSHRAYELPEPSGRADAWPPRTIEEAMDHARRNRAEQPGLAVDDATLRRVAEYVTSPDYATHGLFYTPEEMAEISGFPDDVRERVRALLRAHPSTAGDVRLGWEEGHRIMVVGVAGDRALEQTLLAVDRRIRVEAAVRPAAELDALARRLGDERDGMEAAGFSFLMIAVDHGRGVVDVDVVGRAGPEAAAAHFLDRYGEAVAVRWVAPSRLAERPRAFASWTSEGRMLRVFSAIDHNGERRGSATLEHEDEREVAVAVTCFAPVGPHTLIGGIQRQHHDLELSAPVGDRRVIDAATGEARPSVDELGVR